FLNSGRYSGTPLLWHALLVPFARAGLAYETTLPWLHWFIAAAATGVFLVRARLPLALRAAFVFSHFALFEYAVVARSYSLTLLFLWCALATWPQRREAPGFFLSLALLAQTNV